MPKYSIELLWTCHVCGRVGNRGLRRHCGGCGHPKDDKDEEFFPDDISIKNALHGQDKQRAEAGPDYHCKYCRSLQSALNRFCDECGADQQSAAESWEATEKTATLDVRTGERHESTGDRVKVVPVAPTPPTESAAEPVASTRLPSITFSGLNVEPGSYRQMVGRALRPGATRPRRFWPLVLGLGAVLFVGFGIWWLVHPRYERAQVAALSWERGIDIERYQLFSHDGWTPPLVGAVDLVDEGPRVHHTEHVLVGSHKETVTDAVACGENCKTVKGKCTTTRVVCTKNKNGTADCKGGDQVCAPDSQSCEAKTCDVVVKDYDDVPVMWEWYAWKEWDWGFHRTVRRSGAQDTPSWPSPEELTAPLGPGESERQGRRSEQYRVTFQAATGSYPFEPRTEGEFARYTIGSRWTLQRNAMSVTAVLPP